MARFEDMKDKELMYWFYLSQELKDLKYLKAIKKEFARRNRDE